MIDRVYRYIAVFFRLLVGLAFIWASWDKLLNPEDFELVVATYGIAGPTATRLVARVLPWVEVAVGFWLISGIQRQKAATAALLLLAGFIAVVVSAWGRPLPLGCGCFELTAEVSSVGPDLLLRDLILLVMAEFVRVYR